MAVRALGIFLNFALVSILAVSQVSSRSVVIFSGVRLFVVGFISNRRLPFRRITALFHVVYIHAYLLFTVEPRHTCAVGQSDYEPVTAMAAFSKCKQVEWRMFGLFCHSTTSFKRRHSSSAWSMRQSMSWFEQTTGRYFICPSIDAVSGRPVCASTCCLQSTG